MDTQVLKCYYPFLQKHLQGMSFSPFHDIPYKEEDEHLSSKVFPLVENIREVVKKEHLTSEELDKEILNIILNILTSGVLELKKQINETNKSLWEKALSKDLTEEEIKQFEVFDKFFFLQSNILGIIGESQNIKLIKELIKYSHILTLRMLEIIENNGYIEELEDDFKVIARKLKSVVQEPKALDDYFIDEFLEE